jgi:hypothetical protein
MGVEGGYGSFDVKQLWQMVESAMRELPQSHAQVGAWDRAHQALDEHGTRLQGYRNDLAAQWPPEQNPAAAAYLQHLDNLLLAVDQTAKASAANAKQLLFVIEAVQDAHKQLKPLHDEYVNNERKLAGYNAQITTISEGAKAAGGPINGYAYGAIAKFGAELFTSSPVPDGRQHELNNRAREAMMPLSGAAQDAIWNMQPPPEYKPPAVESGYDTGNHIGGSSGGATRPPAIAPPAHTRYGSGDAYVPPAPHDDGPVLSGTPVNTLPPSNYAVPSDVPQPGPRPLTSLPQVSLGVPPVFGGQGPLPAGRAGRGIGIGDRGAGKAGIGMPPGGILGRSNTGGTQAVAAGGRRVNPVGGVIGHTGQPAAGAGPGMMSGQRGRASTERDGRTWDPDNPWAVDRGVAPVLLPDDEPKSFDAGPGVIGVDR